MSRRHPRAQPKPEQPTLPSSPPADEHLDISALETWLWDAACAVRGATDEPKFKDFILPLVFYKCLSDVFDDEFVQQVEQFGDEQTAHEVVKADRKDALKTGRKDTIVRFYIPRQYRWEALRNHPADGSLGEFVTGAMRWAAREWATLIGVNLRQMKSKWASISTAGRLTLNRDLLMLPRHLGEFAIVHELIHRLVPNHGNVFKSFMHAYIPDWAERERRIPSAGTSVTEW